MVFTHSYKIEETVQWISIGGGHLCTFDVSGKFCAKVSKNHVELWETRNFHVPMTALPYPAVLSSHLDVVCYNLTWSIDAKTLIGAFGSRIGGRKVVQREVYIIVWDVTTLRVQYVYRIPFSVTSMCSVPLDNNRYALLGCAEVDCHLLLDTKTGSIREVVFGGESVLFHFPDSKAPLINCVLTNISSSFEPNETDSPISSRAPDRADELWMARLDHQEGPLEWRKSTSAFKVSQESLGSAVLYVVCNSYGIANRIQKISISSNNVASDPELRVLSSLELTGFTERVTSVVLNADYDKLLLVSSNCSSLQLFTTTPTSADDLSFRATLLKAGDVVCTVQGEVLPALSNNCIGAGFVLSTWPIGRTSGAGSTAATTAAATHRMGKSQPVSTVEESVLVGVPTAGSVYTSKLILCRLPVIPSAAAPVIMDVEKSSFSDGSDAPVIEYRAINAPRAGLAEIFVRPSVSLTSPTTTALAATRASSAVVGIDPVGRTLLLHWACLHSDFPGPMYPIGYNLIQQCSTYLEAEDELDKVMTGGGTGGERVSGSSSSGNLAATISAAGTNTEASSSLSSMASDGEAEGPVSKRSRISIDIGGVFDLSRNALSGSIGCATTGAASRDGLQRLSFTVAQHFMPTDEKRHYRTGKKASPLPTATAASVGGSVGDPGLKATDPLAAPLDQIDPVMDVTHTGTSTVDGLMCEDVEEGEGGSASGSVFNFLSDALGIPHKITTGDYSVKQKRDHDQGAATLALCQDRGHVSKVLRAMKRDAVERSEAQEDAKERQRLKAKERAEEKRLAVEAAKRAKAAQERLLVEAQREAQRAAAAAAAATATASAVVQVQHSMEGRGEAVLSVMTGAIDSGRSSSISGGGVVASTVQSEILGSSVEPQNKQELDESLEQGDAAINNVE